MVSQNIVELAREQLGLSLDAPDSLLPYPYLSDLEEHIKIYPHYTNFTVDLSNDYGFVTCLEEGCSSTPIPLTPVYYQGQPRPIGSLSAYRSHCATFHSPVRSWDYRMALEGEGRMSNVFVKAEPTEPPIVRDDLMHRAFSQYEPVNNAHGLVMYERGVPTITRKRPSEEITDNEYFDGRSSPSTSKRLKKEQSLKSPLAPSNLANGPSSMPTSAEYRVQRLDIAIAESRRYLDALNRKSAKSRTDELNIKRYHQQLVSLENERRATMSTMNTSATPFHADFSIPTMPASATTKLEPYVDDSDSEDESAGSFLSGLAASMPYIPPDRNANAFDENGDFHGRGRDNFQGPTASPDDIDKFLRTAGNSEQFDANESLGKALEKIGLNNQYELLPGMKVPLMPHQVIGTAWMQDREKGSMKGGCLADDMGLGKTIQMIALMTLHKPIDHKVKTTLIVTPAALLGQWKQELEEKSGCDWKICIYHGSSKPKSKHQLLEYDVVITTYNTMALEWPDDEEDDSRRKKENRKKAKKKNEDFIISDDEDNVSIGNGTMGKAKKKKEGLLLQVTFFRIILDESQAIRNRRTRTSRASTKLQGEHRWCITGTPIINSLVDGYGYLRFLQIRPWHDWAEFNKRVAIIEKRQPYLAATRLQSIFHTMLLRRLKDSELDGKKLIELPPKTVELDKLEFSEEERTIYTMVEARSQVQFNRYLKAGTVLKNYSQVLVMLLRLRQVCSHPCLVQENGIQAAVASAHNFTDLTPELATERTRARRLVGQEFVDTLKKRLLRALAKKRVEAVGEDISSCFPSIIDEEVEGEDPLGVEGSCSICFDVFTDPRVAPCGHVFCQECIDGVLNEPLELNNIDPATPDARNPKERPCPSCPAFITPELLFDYTAFEPTEKELNPNVLEAQDFRLSDPDYASKMSRGAQGNAITIDSSDEEEETSTRGNPPHHAVAQKKRTRYQELPGDESDDMSNFIVESGEDEEDKDERRELKRKLGKRRMVVVLDSDEELSENEKEVVCGMKPKNSVNTLNFASGSKFQVDMNTPIPSMDRFLPSTKMKYMMNHIEKLAKEKPNEKIIVVSQWTSCIALVSDYLTEKEIMHVKYQGDMSRPKREAAVRLFMCKEAARIMLMSQKCGGVGLNLVRANNVISLDLGWNPAVESQAFDRAHRLGQQRPVLVKRLVIANTVEDRILALQDRKQHLAEGALGEGKTKKIGRLNIAQLAELFGLDNKGRRI